VDGGHAIDVGEALVVAVAGAAAGTGVGAVRAGVHSWCDELFL
jgi:hypothetical protein